MGSITEISACGSPGRRELLAEDSGSEDEDTSEFGSEGERARKRPRARTGRTPDAKQRRIEFRDLREAMKKVYRIAAAQQDCGLPILWAACVAGHLDSGSMSEAFYREMSHQVYHQFAQEFDNTSADAQPPRPQSTTGDGGARPAPQREGVRTSSQRRRAFFDGFDIIRSNDPGGVRSALLRGLNMLRQVVAQMLSDALADLATKLHSAIEMRITEMGDELEERRARRESGSRNDVAIQYHSQIRADLKCREEKWNPLIPNSTRRALTSWKEPMHRSQRGGRGCAQDVASGSTPRIGEEAGDDC
ncbi:hypothetical protein FOZ60_013541 [Perkinsus olseni]|uniref:Uncharacterized protein n=1 Tax=Perkinsus olseni TaxID=32597 RepID=A0A7J6NA91_PEROL|nr:hypothetical protein FOZ60_013541 [Perkinsus olseni]